MESLGLDFLSREELLSFRTATTLLGYLDITEQRGEVEKGKVVQLEAHEGRSKLFSYSKLSHFTNMLIRNNEVVAVVPAAEAAETVEVIAVVEEDLYLTQNPRM